jgi:hypothetical protein
MFQMIGNTFFSFVEFLNFYLVSISFLRIEKKKKTYPEKENSGPPPRLQGRMGQRQAAVAGPGGTGRDRNCPRAHQGSQPPTPSRQQEKQISQIWSAACHRQS